MTRKRRITSYFKFDQAIGLLAITQTGREQSGVDSRASNREADGAGDQDHDCAEPKQLKPTEQTLLLVALIQERKRYQPPPDR
jgi:hypothetical protein